MHFNYSKWDPALSNTGKQPPFDTLWDLFRQLLTIASGDVAQALRWLTDLDKEYSITDRFEEPYTIGDFIEELKARNYLEEAPGGGAMMMTAKTERSIRRKSLEEIFRGLDKSKPGFHKTNKTGRGLERQPETRRWNPGDDIGQIDSVGTMMNMLSHSSLDAFRLREDDLSIYNTDHYSSAATVLLIDLSHSMILYGEDRITPAKKVAMALSELIISNYAKDTLDIIAFGNEAWEVAIKDLPYLQAGPFHTNTLQALERARYILQRKKNANRQIFMITDGKPSCIIENGKLYKNSFGLDRKIVNKVLDEAVKCRREKITINTFMIARDPYLQHFVREMTEANKGRAYFSTPDNLGGYVFEDYIKNRRRSFK